MEQSIIISGFGGQGVLFAGQLLAYTGMDLELHVTWIPSYGPEMRGGTANCTVIISDEPIGAPIVARPDAVIALNQPSFDKYEPLIKEGGAFIINSSLVEAAGTRSDLDALFLPANTIAEQYGTIKMLNMVAVGALLALRPVLPLEAVEKAIAGHLPARKAHLAGQNVAVLHQGFAYGARSFDEQVQPVFAVGGPG